MAVWRDISPVLALMGFLWLTWRFAIWEQIPHFHRFLPDLPRKRPVRPEPLHPADAQDGPAGEMKPRARAVLEALDRRNGGWRPEDAMEAARCLFKEVAEAIGEGDKRRLFDAAVSDDVFEALSGAVAARRAWVTHLAPPRLVDAHLAQGRVSLVVAFEAEWMRTPEAGVGLVTWRSAHLWRLAAQGDGWRVEAVGEDGAAAFAAPVFKEKCHAA
jgi:hypothetical protein